MVPSVEHLLRCYETLKGPAFFDALHETMHDWIRDSQAELINQVLKGADPAKGASPYNCVALLRAVYRAKEDLVQYWPLVVRVEAYLPGAVGEEMTRKYLRGGLVKRPTSTTPPKSTLGLGYTTLESVMANGEALRRSIISDEDQEVGLQHLEKRRKEGATIEELDADPKLKQLAEAHGIHTWGEFK